jgi:hypothetical protein
MIDASLMAMASPFGAELSPERWAALPLREQDRYLKARAAAGNPVQMPAPEADVREADTSGGSDVSVRESASVSDLPGLMSNVMYRRIDEWFSQFRMAAMDYAFQIEVPDYRVQTTILPSELEDALEIRQERDYLDSGLKDKLFTYQLKKWGRSLTLPFQVIENDDKNFIATMPARLTRAAERSMAKTVVRNTLEANPNAYDGVALFSASRANALMGGLTGNLVSGAGSALSSANIQAGLAAVNSFTGDPDLNPSGVPINVPAKYLVVPPSLALQAAQMLNSTVLIAAGTANPITVLGNQNPLRQTDLQPIVELKVERYLTNSTAYYLLPEKEYGPLAMIVRQGRGLRPRLMRNVPMRQSIGGGGADQYLLLHDDVVFLFNYDLNCVSFKPFSAIKFAGA